MDRQGSLLLGRDFDGGRGHRKWVQNALAEHQFIGLAGSAFDDMAEDRKTEIRVIPILLDQLKRRIAEGGVKLGARVGPPGPVHIDPVGRVLGQAGGMAGEVGQADRRDV
jgi:choline dehydrogenase-like flavoprotein